MDYFPSPFENFATFAVKPDNRNLLKVNLLKYHPEVQPQGRLHLLALTYKAYDIPMK